MFRYFCCKDKILIKKSIFCDVISPHPLHTETLIWHENKCVCVCVLLKKLVLLRATRQINIPLIASCFDPAITQWPPSYSNPDKHHTHTDTLSQASLCLISTWFDGSECVALCSNANRAVAQVSHGAGVPQQLSKHVWGGLLSAFQHSHCLVTVA